MSDYSYYIVTKEPPRPSPTIFHWIESFFHPVQFATEGEGLDWSGHVTSKRFWKLYRGRLTRSGIDHTELRRGFRE